MRFIILTRFHSQHTQGEFVLRMATAAAEMGHSLSIVNPADIILDFSRAPAPMPGSASLPHSPVRWRELPFPAADLILPIARWDDEYTWQIVETLRAWGQPVYPHNRIPLGDSITMARLFARRGIPAPRSWVLSAADHMTVILPEITFPCIIRSRHGGRGRNLHIAQHSGEALELAYKYANVGQPFLVQDLPQPWGEDLRVLIIGNKVAAAVHRTAPTGFVRPREAGNLKSTPVELTEAETRLAIQAADIYNAPFCAVSILRAQHGPLLLEVARAPVLSEIESATGLNLAAAILHYMEQLATTPRANIVPLQPRASTR